MKVSSRVRRLREFLMWSLAKSKPVCMVCGQVITPAQVGGQCEDLTIHHVDENRGNNDAANLELVHKGCHRWHHYKELEIRAGRPEPKFPGLCPVCRRCCAVDEGKCRECARESRKTVAVPDVLVVCGVLPAHV